MNVSLKWKIQAWHAIVLILVVTTLALVFYFHQRRIMLNELDTTLDQQIHPLLFQSGALHDDVRSTNRPQRQARDKRESLPNELEGGWINANFSPDEGQTPSNESFEGFESMFVPQGYYAMVWSHGQDRPLYQSPGAPEMEAPDISLPGYWIRNVDGKRRDLYHRTPHAKVLVGRYLDGFRAELNALKWQIIAVSVGIVLFGVLAGGWLVSRTLKPLTTIQHAMRSIAKGELENRISEDAAKGTKEWSTLIADLNNTFSQLEKQFKRQTQFTADASHELRTPLTALAAQVDLGLMRQRTVAEHEEILQVCQRSVSRLKRITEELLELSKLDSGRVKLELQRLPLSELMATLCHDMRSMVEYNGCQLIHKPGGGMARCDPFRIEQVVTNLINNAIQHNDRALEIVVRTYETENHAVIEVTDNGKGIQPENLEHLFDRFFQESKSRTTGHGKALNIGLGLAISKAIVDAHGGVISVSSIPNERTTFTIALPKAANASED